MGAFLEKPITEKHTEKGVGKGLKYGVSAMQGWRKEMEDKHVCSTEFSLSDHAFFGVFDGHAGVGASKYCSDNLLTSIIGSLKDKSNPTLEELKVALRDGFLALDVDLRKVPGWSSGEIRGGTTAVTVMITPDKIIWGNCGDSRGILCRSGQVEFVTQDHKPGNDGERRRIEKAGGSVMMQRVNGSLAVSRALGDFEFKMVDDLPPTDQLVSPEPEVTVTDRDSEHDEFLLLACDGVYDVMSNEEVVKFVRNELKRTDDLPQICSDLIDLCLNKNSRDNMSVILITFEGAPQVSEESIAEYKKLQETVHAFIMEAINKLVAAANDPLELEENEVIQSLGKQATDELADYEFIAQRSFVVEVLAELKKEKFGEPQPYDGPSDSSEAPKDFYYRHPADDIFPNVSQPTVPMDEGCSDSTLSTESPSTTDSLPSPLQTDTNSV